MPWRWRAPRASAERISCARAWTSFSGISISASATAASSTARLELALHRRSSASRSLVAMSSRSSSSVSNPAASAAKSSSSSGSRLALTSLTVTSNVACLPLELALGQGDLDGAVVARRGARQLLVEAGQQPAGAELDQTGRVPRRQERLPVDRAEVVDHHGVAALGGALDRFERPYRSRSRSSSSSTCLSSARGSRLPTSSPLYVPSVAAGRTPTSIENWSG